MDRRVTDLGWYARRLARMGPREVAGRARAARRVHRWRRLPTTSTAPVALPDPVFTSPLDAAVLGRAPEAAVKELLRHAEEIMDGRLVVLGVARTDLVEPDWHHDPRTGRTAPRDAYAFDVPYRDEQAVGDVKQLWEPSRHQHLTVLAAAYAVTGDTRFAERAAAHLRSWWAADPPLRGVHWVSGIELGIRLVSWVWVRRLLDGWAGAPALFERNPVALHQIGWHQRWLAAFPSHGSSANNHAVAESAGLLAAACAFPWFAESEGWRRAAVRALDRHLVANTFPSGLNRELATEYHGLVLDLGFAAVAEARAAGVAVPDPTWDVLVRMADALAATVDTTLHPARQGDGDDGRGLVLDAPGSNRWASLLDTAGRVFGPLPWWPEVPADVRSTLTAALLGTHTPAGPRPADRPAHFADAGLTLLRSPDGADELWCRCDAGPHGFLSIAAHAHADALSVEVRQGGVEVLADPGCSCYHGEPAWRRYFRSTLGHSTLELDGTDQSRSGGPFLWSRHARSRVLAADAGRWAGEHDGYGTRRHQVVHRRVVERLGAGEGLRITDTVRSAREHAVRVAFHLGPAVDVELDTAVARLGWEQDGVARAAVLVLPAGLGWTVHRGEEDPPLGWYSPSFGVRVPSAVLVGKGRVAPGSAPLRSTLRFLPRPGTGMTPS